MEIKRERKGERELFSLIKFSTWARLTASETAGLRRKKNDFEQFFNLESISFDSHGFHIQVKCDLKDVISSWITTPLIFNNIMPLTFHNTKYLTLRALMDTFSFS